MDEINKVSRSIMKIVQPHPGPIEESSQLGSEVISYSGTLASDKLSLSDTLFHSPDKQSKQQFLFKQASAAFFQKDSTTSRFSQKKAKSFLIPSSSEEAMKLEYCFPNIRIKSQSNLNQNEQKREDLKEKQIGTAEYANTIFNYKQSLQQQTAPSFGVGLSELKTPSLSQYQNYQMHNNNNNNNNNHTQSIPQQMPYHTHHGSVSTFSFQQFLPSQQTGTKKQESLAYSSPPNRFAFNEELASDIMRVQDDEDSYNAPYPTHKPSSEDNKNSNKNNIHKLIKQKDQQMNLFHPINNNNNNNNRRFQLSLYQAETNMGQNNSDDVQSQIMITDMNNNKSSSELNIDETSHIYANNLITNQYSTDNYQAQYNVPSEIDEFTSEQKGRQKQVSYLNINNNNNNNNGELTEEERKEEEENNDDNDEEEELRDDQIQLGDNANKDQNQIQLTNMGVIAFKNISKSPLGKLQSKTSPMNFLFNNKNSSSKISGIESEFPRLKSEIYGGNSVSQQRDDQSNLHLMNQESNQLQQEDLQEIANRKEKSMSMVKNVIQVFQKARQKHLERAKADKQEKIMKKVREFIKILKMRSNLRSPSLIKKKILEIINDLVYPIRTTVFRVQNKQASFRLSRALLKVQIPTQNWLHSIYIKINIPLFHPQSLFKLTWDFIHISIILLIFFYIPIQMVTGKNMGRLIGAESEWGNVILLMFLFFIVDILISFNTGIYDQGIVNENRKDVAVTYIKGQMILDIVYSVSVMKTYYDMQSEQLFSILCGFFLFIKIFTLRRIINNFTDILLSIRNNTKLYYIIELISLLVTILFVGHIFACAFWSVAEQTSESSKTWMKKVGVQNEDWQTKQQFFFLPIFFICFIIFFSFISIFLLFKTHKIKQ